MGSDAVIDLNRRTNMAKKTNSQPPRSKSVGSATAASILGKAVQTAFSPDANTRVRPEWSKYYKHLLELRERLLNQMSGLAKESAEQMPNYSLHMADSGTDNFDRDFALSLL